MDHHPTPTEFTICLHDDVYMSGGQQPYRTNTWECWLTGLERGARALRITVDVPSGQVPIDMCKAAMRMALAKRIREIDEQRVRLVNVQDSLTRSLSRPELPQWARPLP